MSEDQKSTLVVYYSQSHHSQKLANAIATKLNVNTYEIEVDRYHLPVLGYLRAGLNSITGKLPSLTNPVPDFQDYQRIVICGPVWTSYPATPIRAFLRQYGPTLPAEVALFLTSGGHSPPEEAFEMAQTLLGRPLKVAMNISNSEQETHVFETKVATFCEALNEPFADQAIA